MFLQTSTDNVGIGTNTPLGKVHIQSTAVAPAAAPSATGDDLVIERGVNPGISILSNDNSFSSILFGTDVDPDGVRLRHDPTNDRYDVMVADAGGTLLRRTSTLSNGIFRIGSVTPGQSPGRLDVLEGDAGNSPPTAYNNISVESDVEAGISLLAGDATQAGIAFGSSVDNNAGIIDYAFNGVADDLMTFTVGGVTDILSISGNGNLAVKEAPSDDFEMTLEGSLQLVNIANVNRFVAPSTLAGQDTARIFVQDDTTGVNAYGTGVDGAIIFESMDLNTVNPDSGFFFFNTGNDDIPEVALSILGNGNTGVKTLTPSTSFQVGDIDSGGGNSITVGSNGAGNQAGGQIIFHTSDDHDAVIDAYHIGAYEDRLRIRRNTNGNDFNLSPNGYVGVGVSNPTFHIDAAGDIRAQSTGDTRVRAQSSGGVGSVARFRVQTASQTWGIGSTNATNSDEFYIRDVTNAGARRFAIIPWWRLLF